MLSLEQLSAFLLVASVITISPGPDNMLVLSIGISKGRLAGVAFGLGCALGCLSHTLLAVLGVSALIAASPEAFTALKIGGGLYLVWLGINALRSTGAAQVNRAAGENLSLGRLFLKGMFANAINPKVILFFLSFLPQFIVAERGSVNVQMALLGIVFTAQAALIFGLLGYFSGTVGQWMSRRPGIGKLLDRVAGIVFVGLGLRLIVSR